MGIAPKVPFARKKGNYAVVYRVLLHVKGGAYVAQIARQLRYSPKQVRYIVQKCMDLGYLELLYRGEAKHYKLTPQGEDFLVQCKKLAFQAKNAPSSVCVSEGPYRAHNFRFKLDILRQNAKADFSGEQCYHVSEGTKNWVGKYFLIPFPTAMTVEVTPKSVIVNFHEFQSRPHEFASVVSRTVMRGLFCVHGLFLKKYDILVDIANAEAINAHIANERPDLRDNLPKSSVVSVDLGRHAEAVFPAGYVAKAWVDWSKKKGRGKGGRMPEVETNDMPYAEKLLWMPEAVDRLERVLVPAVEQNTLQSVEFSKQLALHLAAIEGIKAGVEAEGVALRESRAAIQELRDAVRALRGVPVADVDEGGRLGYG